MTTSSPFARPTSSPSCTRTSAAPCRRTSLWEIAHLQGIALPTKDYWEFVDLTSISDPRGVDGLAGLDRIYHLTELIQSSPLAVERSVLRHDRRRLPLAAHHDLRGALQPDEAQPRRRARPRPHDPGRHPRPRHRRAGLPAGARRADPDDGSHLQRRAERDHRREGHPLRPARRRRHRHRRPAAGARAASPYRDLEEHVRDRARGRASA